MRTIISTAYRKTPCFTPLAFNGITPPAEPKNRNYTAMVPQRDYHVSHIRIMAGRSCQINLTDDPKISAN